MKICIIISSDEWRGTAGVRIRYMRLQPALKAEGHTLELRAIGDFTSLQGANADIYVFSKTHDVRSVLLARMLRSQGSRIGIDLFDDYYSQVEDSRFVHLRRWFRMMVPTLDFAMCSTPKMARRLARLAPALRCQVVNDPFGYFDADAVADTTARNAQIARQEKHLRIGWFGIGDNPHFSLGLDDLFAFSGDLLGARRLGYEVSLEILTNPRALTAQRMEMLARLPVPFTLEYWNEARETALIERSVACFLPVNAQVFSVVKSLNRGVSTLTGGSQLLSAGFPLYDLLDDFVYRDIETLIADLEQDHLRLRRDTTGRLGELMAQYGTAEQEARTLTAFFEGSVLPGPCPCPWPEPDTTMLVLHGLTPSGVVHKAIRRFGALSVAAPQTRRALNFDLSITSTGDGGETEILLSTRARSQLRLGWFEKAVNTGIPHGEDATYRITLSPDDMPPGADIEPVILPILHLTEMVRYKQEMDRMLMLINLLFPAPRIFLAETLSPYNTGSKIVEYWNAFDTVPEECEEAR